MNQMWKKAECIEQICQELHNTAAQYGMTEPLFSSLLGVLDLYAVTNSSTICPKGAGIPTGFPRPNTESDFSFTVTWVYDD